MHFNYEFSPLEFMFLLCCLRKFCLIQHNQAFFPLFFCSSKCFMGLPPIIRYLIHLKFIFTHRQGWVLILSFSLWTVNSQSPHHYRVVSVTPPLSCKLPYTQESVSLFSSLDYFFLYMCYLIKILTF